MNNFDCFYPDRVVIEQWITYLKDENTILKLKLPHNDEDWYSLVLGTIERLKISPCNSIYEKGARLFYYLNKGHNFVDGNKRTSIVVTFLFFFVNGIQITNPIWIENLAKKIAKIKGTSESDSSIMKISRKFKYMSKPTNIDVNTLTQL